MHEDWPIGASTMTYALSFDTFSVIPEASICALTVTNSKINIFSVLLVLTISFVTFCSAKWNDMVDLPMIRGGGRATWEIASVSSVTCCATSVSGCSSSIVGCASYVSGFMMY